MKTFTSVRGLPKSELSALADTAIRYAEGEAPTRSLLDRSVGLLFFERSTRTRVSFELAARKLGADVVTLDPERSSTGKGESLYDTVTTLSAIGIDIFVIRHPEPGTPQLVGEWTGLPVVNAGDGAREHPTQALTDIVTLRRHFGALEGLRMGIVGDLSHSRVAGSLIHSMPAMGVGLTLVGPPEFLPYNPEGIEVTSDLDAVLERLDVVYLLRIQTERGACISDSYSHEYGLDERRAAVLPEAAVVMHAGPMNRGVEIADAVADGPRSLILQQVSNGVPARMAVLNALEGALG